MHSLLGAIAEKNTEGVRIHTLGTRQITMEREEFLRELAAQNGGSYYRIPR